MRTLKLAGLLAGCMMAICALLPAAASAVKPEFLDGTLVGLKFTGESTKTTVHAVGLEPDLVCKKDKLSGEVTGEKTIKATIDFEGCTEMAFATNSLGDAKEVVLVPVSGELCYINEANKEVGVYTKIKEEVHVEIPGLGELEAFSGTVIGKVEFVNKLQALQDISYKKVNIAECGGKKASLLDEINHSGKPVAAELETLEELHFEKDIEIMG